MFEIEIKLLLENTELDLPQFFNQEKYNFVFFDKEKSEVEALYKSAISTAKLQNSLFKAKGMKDHIDFSNWEKILSSLNEYDDNYVRIMLFSSNNNIKHFLKIVCNLNMELLIGLEYELI